jgi:MerR family transcriptional regulator, light-induced transcriptional regulator
MDNDIPTFNLKAVVQETGLKPDTLRAWERRYGLPTPDRSGGGHRLYSQRDMETLKWLVSRQHEGMSISRAADLWQRHVEAGEDPLTLPAYRSSEAMRRIAVAGGELDELRREWIAACRAFDETRAEAILSQAFALYPTESVLLDLLQRGLSEVGDGWYVGTVTTQQEHFASELALRRLESVLLSTPPPTRKGRVLIACPPGEQHTFAPLLLTLLLRRRGWHVSYLGANVPMQDLDRAIAKTRADLVIAPVQTLPSAAHLPEMGEIAAAKGLPLAYGGRIAVVAPVVRQRLPGHYLGDSLPEAVERIEALLQLATPSPSALAPTAVYRRSLQAFDAALPLIVADLSTEMGSAMPAGVLHEANLNFTAGIRAALKLGDIELLGSDIAWVEGLIGSRQMNHGSLASYLHACARAAQSRMGEASQPITSWINGLTFSGR